MTRGMCAPSTQRSDSATLIEDIIAELAREKGVALARDDPLLEVVLLNQAIVKRYMDEAVEPITQAITTALKDARTALQEHTTAEIAYIEETLLKDREQFLKKQEAILEKMDQRLQKRDTAVMEMFAAVLEKVRERILQERSDAQHAARIREAQQAKEIARHAAFTAIVSAVGVVAISTAGIYLLRAAIGQ